MCRVPRGSQFGWELSRCRGYPAARGGSRFDLHRELGAAVRETRPSSPWPTGPRRRPRRSRDEPSGAERWEAGAC